MLVDAETFLGFNFIHFYFVFNVSDNGYILSLLGYEAFSFPFKGPRIHYKYPKKKCGQSSIAKKSKNLWGH